jgi:hypothetical protein
MNPIADAEALIETAGDQAYQEAVKMTVLSVSLSDDEGAKHFSAVAKELMRRGYHRKPPTKTETIADSVSGVEG